jgi:hypothetical protein
MTPINVSVSYGGLANYGCFMCLLNCIRSRLLAQNVLRTRKILAVNTTTWLSVNAHKTASMREG